MNKQIAILFLLMVLSAKLCIGQAVPDHAKLPPADSLSNKDFEPVAPYLAKKRVILAGEASHGGMSSSPLKQLYLNTW
jgi:hypothetical protein